MASGYVTFSPTALNPSEISATADATTTSGTDVLLTGMTTTPAAGTYLVLFSSSITSNAAGAAITSSFYVAGVQKADSIRKISPFDGGTLSATTARGAMVIQGLIAVTGSQAIEVRWSISSGTGTCGPRTMNLIKVI